jgi:predicted PurR-regulated permease PerM
MKDREIMQAVATAITAAIIIAALYFGREVFVPIALAILLSFVLAPLVRSLQRWRVPRVMAVIGVVLLAFAAIFAVAGIIATQVAELARDLPRYQLTMREKIQSLRGTAATSGTLERAAGVLQELSKELKSPDTVPADDLQRPMPGKEVKPIPVEVRQPPPTALENIAALIAPLLQPLATTGISAIFVVFILLQREDLRNRFIKLAGAHDLQKTTVALDDAATRLSRLYLVQLALNTAFGAVIGVGLWAIGVPSPALWGILAAILRFVPYIGAVISAVFPLTLAAAVDPGWTMLLWTLALFLVVEPLIGHVIEPLLYGQSTGLSPIAVMSSATFWTALWGPVGLVLATPLTVCLVVLGRYVERFKFLDIMFGDRPALSPPQLFYQRMLAEDPMEAADQAERFLKERSLSAYYDEVALPALLLAQNDVYREAIDRTQSGKIRDAVMEVVEQLDDQEDRAPERTKTARDPETTAALETASPEPSTELPVLDKTRLAPAWAGERPVLCIGARGPLDEAAASILAQLLKKHGLGAETVGAETRSGANLLRLDPAGVAMVCLSYLDASSPAHMRYTVRRLRRTLAGAQIIVCCWMREENEIPSREALQADGVATTLREALHLCVAAAQEEQGATRAEPTVVVARAG